MEMVLFLLAGFLSLAEGQSEWMGFMIVIYALRLVLFTSILFYHLCD